MKQTNKLYVVLLMIFVILFVNGCTSHPQKKSTSTQSTSAPSTSVIPEKTNNSTSTTADIKKILKDQRAELEHEKVLQKDTAIAAKVNDTVIYQHQIEIKMIQNNRYLENYRKQLDTMTISEQEKTKLLQTYTATLKLNKKDIMNEFIRDAVIQIQVGKRGLFPTDREAIAKAQETYVNIKKTPGLYESNKQYMEVMNLSEEAWLRLSSDLYKKSQGKDNLYRQIIDKIDMETEKAKGFDDAVDKWIAQANITIINSQE